jgi:hypothetical protein
MIYAPSGGVVGAANAPTFAVASGCWSPSFIARQYTGLSSGLAFPPNTMDTSFSSVSFLCHFDNMLTPNKGNSGVANALIGFFSSTQTKFSQSSLSVASSSQQFQASTSSAYAFGTGDFTIEVWTYPNAFATANVWDFRTGANSTLPGYLLADRWRYSLFRLQRRSHHRRRRIYLIRCVVARRGGAYKYVHQDVRQWGAGGINVQRLH